MSFEKAHNLKEKKNPLNTCKLFLARGLAATAAGLVDLGLFHPWDSYVKRLQRNIKPMPFENFFKSAFSLYQGFWSAFGMKIVLRTIKYGGEPLLKSYLSGHTENKSVTAHLISGGLIGMGEGLLTPIDTLKAKKQTEVTPTSYLQLWRLQHHQHFKALPIILIRNAIGTAAFFASDSILRYHVFGLEDKDKLTYKQKMINSAVCPSVGILTSYPADLVKTQIQTMQNPATTFSLFKNVIKTDGWQGLYKGLLWKSITNFPRGWVAFFTIQTFTDWFISALEKGKITKGTSYQDLEKPTSRSKLQ